MPVHWWGPSDQLIVGRYPRWGPLHGRRHTCTVDQPPSWIYPQPRAKNKGRFLCCCPCVIILSCYRIYRKYSWPNSSASNFDIIFHRVTSDFLFYLGWPSIWAWHTFFISMMPHIISYHVIYFFLVGMAHFRSVISGLTWNGFVWVYHIFFNRVGSQCFFTKYCFFLPGMTHFGKRDNKS